MYPLTAGLPLDTANVSEPTHSPEPFPGLRLLSAPGAPSVTRQDRVRSASGLVRAASASAHPAVSGDWLPDVEDVLFVLLTIAVFAVLGLIVRAVEKL